MEPLDKPPKTEDGDNTEAAGGTQVMLDGIDDELEDAPELDDEDVEDDGSDDV